MIVENPATQPHYLTRYFPIKPTIIDEDRSKRGDYYKKPTQYWFVNCKPEYNLIMEPLEIINTYTIAHAQEMDGDQSRKVKRSLIHPQYARRFIREFILDGGEQCTFMA